MTRQATRVNEAADGARWAPRELARARLSRRIAWLVAVGALVGGVNCGRPARSVRIMGSRSDVKTQAGEYDGYAVTFDCREKTILNVIGHGKRWFDGAEPGSPGRDAALS